MRQGDGRRQAHGKAEAEVRAAEVELAAAEAEASAAAQVIAGDNADELHVVTAPRTPRPRRYAAAAGINRRRQTDRNNHKVDAMLRKPKYRLCREMRKYAESSESPPGSPDEKRWKRRKLG